MLTSPAGLLLSAQKRLAVDSLIYNYLVSDEEKKAEPFVKWVGGKRGILDIIIPALPASFNSYFEPFVGGGAVFFALAEKAHGGSLGDVNNELLKTYRVIRDKPDLLLKKLEEHSRAHYAWLRANRQQTERKLRSLGLSYDDYQVLKRKKGKKLQDALQQLNSRGLNLTVTDWEKAFPGGRVTSAQKKKIYYYQVRESTPQSDVDIAARFLYLNRTCFNGLYRVNSKGKFNVPMGDYDAPDIVRKESIRRASLALNNIDAICNGDFSQIKPKKGDFVYLDPPYDIIHSGTFTQYAKDDFDRFDQVRLRDFLRGLDQKGVLWMTSNHDTPFIRRLYRNYRIYPIEVGRSINSRADARGAVGEVLVLNYKPPKEPALRDGKVALLGKSELEAARKDLEEEIKSIPSTEESLIALLRAELSES